MDMDNMFLYFCDDVDVFCPSLLGVLLLFGVFLINVHVTNWCFILVLNFGRFLFLCNIFDGHYSKLIGVIGISIWCNYNFSQETNWTCLT